MICSLISLDDHNCAGLFFKVIHVPVQLSVLSDKSVVLIHICTTDIDHGRTWLALPMFLDGQKLSFQVFLS